MRFRPPKPINGHLSPPTALDPRLIAPFRTTTLSHERTKATTSSMTYYNHGNNHNIYRPGTASDRRQGQQSSAFPAQPGLPTLPTYLMPPATIQRPLSTPPVIMTPEMARARMFGNQVQPDAPASKKFRLGRRKSNGNTPRPMLPPSRPGPSPLDPLPSLGHYSQQQQTSQPQQQQQQSAPSSSQSPDPQSEVARLLGIGEAVSAAKNALKSTSTPVLLEAGHTMASILAIVSNGFRGAKYNEMNEVSLAVHTVTMISSILEVQQHRERMGTPLNPKLNQELEKLVRTFKRVESFLKEQSNRSRISRIVTFRTDADKINIQREILSQALEQFQVTCSIIEEDRTAQINRRLEDIKQNMIATRSNPAATLAQLPPGFPFVNSANAQPRSSAGRP